MQYVGNIVNSVTDFYKELNPSTLSGAIDIIVIKRVDGTLACSPFHVRFGKLQLLRPHEKLVKVKVNGKETKFSMKLGEAGEAFFVFESDISVPSSYATSPLFKEKDETMEDKNDRFSLPEASIDYKKKQKKCKKHFADLVLDKKGYGEDSVRSLKQTLKSPASNREFSNFFALDEARLEKSFSDVGEEALEEFDFSSLKETQSDNEVFGTFKFKRESRGEIKDHRDIIENHKIINSKNLKNNSPIQKSRFKKKVPKSNLSSPTKDLEKSDIDYESKELQDSETAQSINEETFEVEETSQKITLSSKKASEYNIELSYVSNNESNEFEVSFQRNKMNYESFLETYKSTNIENIFIKIEKNYYKYNVGFPYIISLKVFESIPEEMFDENNIFLSSKKKELIKSQEQNRRLSFTSLKNWWYETPVSNKKIPQNNKTFSSERLNTSFSEINYEQLAKNRNTVYFDKIPDIKKEKSEDKHVENHHHFAKTLRLTSDQLKELDLNYGINSVSFGVGKAYCESRIFFWDSTEKIVISDIDGTITKSDALGHIFTMVGKDWTHLGVAKLFSDIYNNGFKFMYLTSRAIGQSYSTREYLKNIRQERDSLPEGPVIMSPDRLFQSLRREVILRQPQVFKMSCLRDILNLFGLDASNTQINPFYAGFGNRITDALSYRSVNVPSSRIFTIEYGGDVRLELIQGFTSSYIKLNDLVDHFFPPVNDENTINVEFNEWSFWRTSFPEIEGLTLNEDVQQEEIILEEEQENTDSDYNSTSS